MDQQPTQAITNPGFRSEKKIRLGTGLGFRNSSQLQRALNKNFTPQNEQNFSNGGQQQQHQMFSATNNNYFVGTNSPSNNLIQSQQIQSMDSPQNHQLSASQTQNGFFRRKINLKMSTTNLKAFLNKQPSDNPLMIKSSKNRFISSHMSQGCIQNYSNSNTGIPPQQQGNFFGSQTSLPCPSMSNSSNTHSPQTFNSIINNTHAQNQTFQTTMNHLQTTLQNNSNIDSKRALNLNSNDQIQKHVLSAFKQGEQISAFNRGKRFSCNPSKNTSLIKQSNLNNDGLKNKLNVNDKSDSDDIQDNDDRNEDGNPMRNHSLTKNKSIANYSHNTESTNATAQISHHNYPNQSSHHYFDTDKVKRKQNLTSSQSLIPSSSSQINIPSLYVKKKLTEAKQYSNQVRQQMFEKEDQEEEENFLELCETLQKINYD